MSTAQITEVTSIGSLYPIASASKTVPLRRAPPKSEPWNAHLNPQVEKSITYVDLNGQEREHIYREAKWGGIGDYALR